MNCLFVLSNGYFGYVLIMLMRQLYFGDVLISDKCLEPAEAWHGMASHGMVVWHGIAWHCKLWYNMVWHRMQWYGLAQLAQTLSHQAQHVNV